MLWIRGTNKEWRPFVSNRVSEIRRRVHPEFWNHCPGSSNPADLPSRGLTSLELSVSQHWRRGPEWLRVNLEPSLQSEVQSMPRECALELKATQSHSLVSMEPNTAIESILDPTKFSTPSRLIGVTAKVLGSGPKIQELEEKRGNQSSSGPHGRIHES